MHAEALCSCAVFTKTWYVCSFSFLYVFSMWYFYKICIWHSKNVGGSKLSVFFGLPKNLKNTWKLGNNWKVFACSEMLRKYSRYDAMPKTTPVGKRGTLRPISSASCAAFYFSFASLHSTLIPHPPFVECFEICRNIPKCFGIFLNILKYFETFWTTLKYFVQVSSNVVKDVETFRVCLEHSQIFWSVLKHFERLWNNLWKILHSFLIFSIFQTIVVSFGFAVNKTYGYNLAAAVWAKPPTIYIYTYIHTYIDIWVGHTMAPRDLRNLNDLQICDCGFKICDKRE